MGTVQVPLELLIWLVFLHTMMIGVDTQGEINQKKQKAQFTTTAGVLDM